jgi:hypothetical protein
MDRHIPTEISKPVTLVGCPYTNILTLVQHINLTGFIHVKMAASLPFWELITESAIGGNFPGSFVHDPEPFDFQHSVKMVVGATMDPIFGFSGDTSLHLIRL